MPRLPNLRFSVKFRDYQRDAIKLVRQYRQRRIAGTTRGAALVCHPTGTGKTAVIAGLVQSCPEIGTALIVTTRQAIRDQLVGELAGNLFINEGKFNLEGSAKLLKPVYVIREGAELELSVEALHQRTSSILPPHCREFAEKEFRRLVKNPSQCVLDSIETVDAILVMTVQMLGSLKKKRKHNKGDSDTLTSYQKLKKNLDLLLFDEGHYEPAPEFSLSARELDKPCVLLSATPFRNDLKAFDIQKDNIHIYKYKDAVAQQYVRNVEPISREPASVPHKFCDDVIKFCEEKYGSDVTKWPRIIIHCDNHARITALGKVFRKKNIPTVGIHERFEEKKGGERLEWQYKAVPNPQSTEAKVWIHQYKLMEGIDDFRFEVVAFFDHLKNVRSVVQQVGRIIRRDPKSPSPAKAYLLDHFRGRISQYWELFTEYDESLSEDFLLKSMTRFYLDAFLKEHPDVDYVDRKFRQPLNVESLQNPVDEILFDRQVSFKEMRNNDLESIAEIIETGFLVRDQTFARHNIKLSHKAVKSDAILYLYVGVSSPDFLLTRFFAEVRHGAKLIVFLENAGLIAVTDTAGSRSSGLQELESIDPDRLESLLSPGEGGRVSAISSRNTNLGNRVIRSRRVSAPSLANVPPILDEHGHVISTLSGYDGNRPRIVDDYAIWKAEVDADFIDRAKTIPRNSLSDDGPVTDKTKVSIKRDIGIANGRVREEGDPLRLQAYYFWLQDLVNQMAEGEKPEGIFERFASSHSKRLIDNAAAENLLLDLYEIEKLYETNEENPQPLEWEDLCIDHKNKVTTENGVARSTFAVTLNDHQHDIDVIFYPNTQRYKLESASIDECYRAKNPQDTTPLVSVINARKAFSVIPEDKRLIYVSGRFYAPGLKFGNEFEQNSFYVGKCLYPANCFKEISSEKGSHVLKTRRGQPHKKGGKYFDPNSLFWFIDDWKNGFDTKKFRISSAWMNTHKPEHVAFLPSIIVCDDMDNETADFIIADEERRRVVLVHAKASSDWKPFSASATQEVCAQAQKNAGLFSLFTLREPPNLKRWHRVHSFRGTGNVSLSVTSRLRHPTNITADNVWDRLKALLLNPQTDREVWIVLGNMLSASTFEENLSNDDPAPESLQLNHLLQTTIAAMAQVGAKTRIFCAP